MSFGTSEFVPSFAPSYMRTTEASETVQNVTAFVPTSPAFEFEP